jgi:membrane-associated phospholipid phosphatase
MPFSTALPTRKPVRPERAPASAVVALAGLLAAPLGHADAVESSGHVLRAAIPAGAWWVARRDGDRDGEIQFAKAFAASTATAYALKKIVDKERPNGDDEAFPSGHATTAFSGAAFLQRRYGWRRAWPAWALATYTGWTRVHADEHDWEDVAGGAALAVAGAWLFVSPLTDTAVAPVALRDGAMLTWSRSLRR